MITLFNDMMEHGRVPTEYDTAILEAMVDKYPWYMPAWSALFECYMNQGRKSDAEAIKRKLVKILPNGRLLAMGFITRKPITRKTTNTVDVIDLFLSKNVGRIKPKDEEPFLPDDTDSETEEPEMISETLAEIFFKQGFKDKAIDIYSKLSLKYPEKSVYFADLIENIKR